MDLRVSETAMARFNHASPSAGVVSFCLVYCPKTFRNTLQLVSSFSSNRPNRTNSREIVSATVVSDFDLIPSIVRLCQSFSSLFIKHSINALSASWMICWRYVESVEEEYIPLEHPEVFPQEASFANSAEARTSQSRSKSCTDSLFVRKRDRTASLHLARHDRPSASNESTDGAEPALLIGIKASMIESPSSGWTAASSDIRLMSSG
jgi:hypothetical protein